MIQEYQDLEKNGRYIICQILVTVSTVMTWLFTIV